MQAAANRRRKQAENLKDTSRQDERKADDASIVLDSYAPAAGGKEKALQRGLLSHGRELNPQPITYEAIALPIELPWRHSHRETGTAGIIPGRAEFGKDAAQRAFPIKKPQKA